MGYKFGVITVTRNNVDTIALCLNSVSSQYVSGDYSVTHIVIDGNSNDGTSQVISNFKHANLIHHRAADRNLWHAMNKGVEIAKHQGLDFICFLNADDSFAHNNYISAVSDSINKSYVDIIYGDVAIGDFVSKGFVIKRRYPAFDLSFNNLKNGFMPPHPGTFCHISCFQNNLFLEDMKHYSSDFHFFCRLVKDYRTFKVLDITSVNMSIRGLSNSNFLYIITRVKRQNNSLISVFSRSYFFAILFGKFYKFFKGY